MIQDSVAIHQDCVYPEYIDWIFYLFITSAKRLRLEIERLPDVRCSNIYLIIGIRDLYEGVKGTGVTPYGNWGIKTELLTRRQLNFAFRAAG